jgi:hypothetical protein
MTANVTSSQVHQCHRYAASILVMKTYFISGNNMATREKEMHESEAVNEF